MSGETGLEMIHCNPFFVPGGSFHSRFFLFFMLDAITCASGDLSIISAPKNILMIDK